MEQPKSPPVSKRISFAVDTVSTSLNKDTMDDSVTEHRLEKLERRISKSLGKIYSHPEVDVSREYADTSLNSASMMDTMQIRAGGETRTFLGNESMSASVWNASLMQPDDTALFMAPSSNTMAEKSSVFDDTSINALVPSAPPDSDYTTSMDKMQQASRSTYPQFMEIYQNTPNEDIFAMLEKYEEISKERGEMIQENSRDGRMKVGHQTGVVANSKDMAALLIKEAQTWRLVRMLYESRLSDPQVDEEKADNILNRDGHCSEVELVTAFYGKDRSIREAQIIIDWLESNAASYVGNVEEQMKYQFPNMTQWENTLNSLLSEVAGGAGGRKQLVTALDMDAPLRQMRHLHHLDGEDEEKLYRVMFSCIRAGQMESAAKLCCHVGEPWRAAMIRGYALYHDENYNSLADATSGSLHPTQGNPNREQWKLSMWQMSSDKQVMEGERAVVGAVCGNLAAMLPACRSWEDYLWAHYKVMVDVRVEEFIRVHKDGAPAHTRADMPQQYWQQLEANTPPEKVFTQLYSARNQCVRDESVHVLHVIQKFIILDDVAALIEYMYDCVRGEQATNQLLRFMSHLVLFYRSLGIRIKEELCVAILEAYVRMLVSHRHIPLIACYTATLPEPLQNQCYASFLENVNDDEQRVQCLQLAETNRLNIQRITKMVVQNVRVKSGGGGGEPDVAAFHSGLEAAISSMDEAKIHAIDWLVYDESQRIEAMSEANSMMRMFIITNKPSAAKAVLHKLSRNSITIIKHQWQLTVGNDELPAEYLDIIKEYECHYAYLTALDAFSDWFRHARQSQPEAPAQVTYTKYTEQLAHEQRMKQYKADVKRWQQQLDKLCDGCLSRFYDILEYGDGGWMRSSEDEASGNRGREMRKVRELCIPRVCQLIYEILTQSGRVAQCMRLVNVIAERELHHCFTADMLKHFITRLNTLARMNLQQGNNVFGFKPLTGHDDGE